MEENIKRAVVSVELPPDQFYSKKSGSGSSVRASKSPPEAAEEPSSASATEVKSKPQESRHARTNFLVTEKKALSWPPIQPGGIIQALSMDTLRTSSCSRQNFFKRSYLTSHLAECNRMYSTNIVGHHGCVNALAFSKGDEQFLATGGDDKRVLVWKVADAIQGRDTLAPICMTSKHVSNVFTIDFSCDNSFIFSGAEDTELIKHDFRTRQFVNSYEHLEAVYSVACHPSSPEVVLTASEDGCIYIIDTRQPRRELGQDMLLCEDLDSYQCVAINPVEHRLVAVSSASQGSALYDTRNRKQVVSYQGTSYPVIREDGVSVCFNSTGSHVFSMYRHHAPTLHSLWEPHALCFYTDINGSYRNSVTMKSGCFMGDNDEYVVSGSDDFRVYVWKVPTETSEWKLPVELREDDQNGAYRVSASLPKWENNPHLVLPGHRSIVNQTRYSKNHRVLASSGVEKIIKLWSDCRLNDRNSVHKTRDPPPRTRYTSAELDRMMTSSEPSDPVDPTQEDQKVLALFDSLVEEDMHGSELSDGSSDFPLFPWPSHLYSDDTTPTDSELSIAATSSLDPPWDDDDDNDDFDFSGDDDEDLIDTYGSDAGDWYSSSSDSEVRWSEDSVRSSSSERPPDSVEGEKVGVAGNEEEENGEDVEGKKLGGAGSEAMGNGEDVVVGAGSEEKDVVLDGGETVPGAGNKKIKAVNGQDAEIQNDKEANEKGSKEKGGNEEKGKGARREEKGTKEGNEEKGRGVRREEKGTREEGKGAGNETENEERASGRRKGKRKMENCANSVGDKEDCSHEMNARKKERLEPTHSYSSSTNGLALEASSRSSPEKSRASASSTATASATNPVGIPEATKIAKTPSTNGASLDSCSEGRLQGESAPLTRSKTRAKTKKDKGKGKQESGMVGGGGGANQAAGACGTGQGLGGVPEDGISTGGAPKAKSKRQRLLQLQSASSSNDFSAYSAEDFLKAKPATHFYSSSNDNNSNNGHSSSSKKEQ